MQKMSKARAARIRDLNDRLRLTGAGGQVVVTSGVAERGREFVDAALQAVRTFTAFKPENDPYDEHDFGTVEVDGQDVYFKVDYYDAAMEQGSADPADPEVTTRVLTVMLAYEY